MILDENAHIIAKKRFQTLQQDFINKHGYRFDYSKAIFKEVDTHIEIICKEHNESFYQTPAEHLRRERGCETCESIRRGNKKNKKGYELLLKLKPIYPHYDYSKFIFNGTKILTELNCPSHGIFYKTPQNLKRSLKLGLPHLCPSCMVEHNSKARKHTVAVFLDKLATVDTKGVTVYTDRYENATSKLECNCHIHGNFIMDVQRILLGIGCPKCNTHNCGVSRRLDFSEFLLRAKEKYGDTYTYDEESYTGIKGSIKITCKKHGEFEAVPRSHLVQHYGCPECAKDNGLIFKPYFGRPTNLYYVKITKDNKDFFKIGITTNEVSKRFCTVSRDNATYEVISTKLFDTGLLAYNIEQEILRSNRNIKIDYVLLEKTGGNSEILTEDIYPTIKHYFEQD